MGRPEAAIEDHLVKQVKLCGGEVRKVKWIGRRGAPDRLVGLPGLAGGWWVEVKAPGESCEPHQLREHKRMRAVGLKVLVVDNKAEIDRLLLPYKQQALFNRGTSFEAVDAQRSHTLKIRGRTVDI